MAIVVGGVKYPAADITFQGSVANTGNVVLPAGAEVWLNVLSGGEWIAGNSVILPQVPVGGTVQANVTVRITAAMRAGTVTAVAAVVRNLVVIARSQESPVLATIESEALITLSGSFDARGV